jgi:hypothetical protein
VPVQGDRCDLPPELLHRFSREFPFVIYIYRGVKPLLLVPY